MPFISFTRATGPLLDHENVGFSVRLELAELVVDVTVERIVVLAEWTYSPSTYTASLVHVLRFLR